jgi:type IV secretion system protein VirD4
MKKLANKFSFYAFLLAFSYMLGNLIHSFITNNYVLSFNFELLFTDKTYLYSAEIFLILTSLHFYFWYKSYWNRNGKNLLVGKEKDKNILSGLEQAHFQNEKELKNNFLEIEFKDLKNTNIDGVVIKAEQVKNKLKISLSKPAHTLVIGTTGSGKTTTFINPTIQILSESKNKPSMLISDPKGELYSLHFESLVRKGYVVKVLDLRNPYNSVRWNPLEKVFLTYQRMLNLENEVINEQNYWLFDNNKFTDELEKNIAVQVEKQKLNDEVYEDLHDIVSILCPVTNKGEPIWESGAKNYILSIALAMLEDSKNPKLDMTIEKFNFYNIMKIATNTENDCKELQKYFQGRDKISQCVSLSKQVVDAADKTRGSYLSNVFDKLSIFSDRSLCALTSKNEIKFDEMAEKPLALFVQIPDEKETRHTLAAMIILQAYKELVAKANTYKDLSLPKNVYFLLDEFGNLPKVHKLEQMITVGRSRKIWLCLVVQSYSQLSKTYDDKSADIIKANCNIQIFIGTNDLKTIEDFSKLCGNFSIVSRNISFNSSRSEDLNTSSSIKERPLIYPSELQQLNSYKNMGNAIISIFGFSPIKSKFTPSFECSKYNLGNAHQRLEKPNYFDEEKVYYDMNARNNLLVPDLEKSALKLQREQGLKSENIEEQLMFLLDKVTPHLFKNNEQFEVKTALQMEEYKKALNIIGKARDNIVHLDDDTIINSLQTLINIITELTQKGRVK